MEKNIIDINVGSSPTNVKTINLKELNIGPLKIVSATPINKQDPKWKDKFKPTLNKEGTILGAVGVSGASADEDEYCGMFAAILTNPNFKISP